MIINILSIFVTSQLLSDWLKDSARKNICLIFLTLDTFQLLSGWLKESASPNIPSMSVTLDTFQSLSGWINTFVSFPGFSYFKTRTTKYICESDDECVGSNVCLSDQYTDTSDFRHISLILY